MKRIIILTAFLLLGIISLRAADLVYVFKYGQVYDGKQSYAKEVTVLAYDDCSVVVYGETDRPFYFTFYCQLFATNAGGGILTFYSDDAEDREKRKKYPLMSITGQGAVGFYTDENSGIQLTLNMKTRGDTANQSAFFTLRDDFNNKTGAFFRHFFGLDKPVAAPPEPTASVDQIWLEHNKWYMGVLKGMEVHVKFQTFNQRGILGVCNALFYLSDGRQIMDTNFQYRSLYGQVVASDSFIPQYDNTTFNDFVIFMPYTELHLSGHWDCMVQVEVVIGGQTAKSDFAYFTYN